MDTIKRGHQSPTLTEKDQILIAIGAATAANCIPCFEHLYEKAITAGIPLAEIRQASDIAGQVKAGANMAIGNSVSELIGDKNANDLPCNKTASGSCAC